MSLHRVVLEVTEYHPTCSRQIQTNKSVTIKIVGYFVFFTYEGIVCSGRRWRWRGGCGWSSTELPGVYRCRPRCWKRQLQRESRESRERAERAERGERAEREEREERTLESVRVLQASSKKTKNNISLSTTSYKDKNNSGLLQWGSDATIKCTVTCCVDAAGAQTAQRPTTTDQSQQRIVPFAVSPRTRRATQGAVSREQREVGVRYCCKYRGTLKIIFIVFIRFSFVFHSFFIRFSFVFISPSFSSFSSFATPFYPIHGGCRGGIKTLD